MTGRQARYRAARTVVVVALGALGCRPTPGGEARPTDTGFPLAYYHDDCAPWDGPALTLALSVVEMETPFEMSYPHARISMYRLPAELAGSTVSWSGTDHAEGYATWCASEDACSPATLLEVRFARRQEAPDVLEGDVYMELEDGRAMGGPFHARRLAFTALCG